MEEKDGRGGQVFRFGDTEIDVIVHGYPGKSVCHGPLGFSTIVLVRRADRLALVDVGSFGQRALLIDHLESRGLAPRDVTDVLLTHSHSHFDHSVNWVLFKNATIVISREELDWSARQPWGETPVPELYMRELERCPTLRTVGDGDEVIPGMTAHMTPGHTPGSIVFVLDTGDRDVVFSGDACKNRAELVSRSAHMTYDPELSRESIDANRGFWARRPGGILVPGHDLPMVHEVGSPRYLGTREAAIRAWYGEDLNETTLYSLLPDAGVTEEGYSGE